MSIEDTDKVDFVTIDNATGHVRLTISDHLDWRQDEGAHLLLLQEKINTYLHFVESGEMHSTMPVTVGRNVIISVAAKYPLSGEATIFFRKAQAVVQSTGLSLEFQVIC
jgi:hypothetical protein